MKPLMPGETVLVQTKGLGFFAMQMFWGHGPDGDKTILQPKLLMPLQEGRIALAAMTLHVDLVGPQGEIAGDVDRLIRCVEKTAALEGRFGENERPILVWHPSGYPEGEDVDDGAVFEGLCSGLARACARAQELGVYIAVEITRCSVERGDLPAREGSRVFFGLKVCIDAVISFPTYRQRAVRVCLRHYYC